MKIVRNESELNIKLPILASEKYLKCKSDIYGWIYNENYIIPFFIDKKWNFSRLVFTNNIISKKKSVEAEEVFLREVLNFIEEESLCDFIYKAQSNVLFQVCPSNTIYVPWGTYVVN